MSSEPPPNPITSTFNLSAWIQAVGSGLSLATASTYFLSKKLADTAIGLITFTGGISTNSITKYGTGEHKIFADDTNTINSNYGEVNNVATFGQQARTAKLGASALNFVEVGKNMVATAGNYIGIGHGTSQLTNIGIGTRAGTDIQSGSGKIIIGGAGNLTSILSDSVLVGTSTSNNYMYSIDTPVSSSNIPLYSSLAEGNLSLCSNQAAGTLALGSGGGRTGEVSLAKATTGNINIGTTMSSGTNIISIGTAGLGKTTINSTNISLQESGNGTINVGNTSGTGALNIYKPLTPAYSYLSASGSVGEGSTGVGKIGQIINSAYSALTAPSGTKSVMGEVVLTAGTWILTGNFNISVPPGSASFAQTSWWLGATQYGITDYSAFSINPRAFSSTTVIYTTGGTYQLKIEMYYAGAVQATAQNTGWNISALRIA